MTRVGDFSINNYADDQFRLSAAFFQCFIDLNNRVLVGYWYKNKWI